MNDIMISYYKHIIFEITFEIKYYEKACFILWDTAFLSKMDDLLLPLQPTFFKLINKYIFNQYFSAGLSSSVNKILLSTRLKLSNLSCEVSICSK